MEKRLNRKIDLAFQDFKHQIKNKMAESDILSTTEGTGLLQFIYDFPVFAITKSDLQKRKRVKNSVPFNERCCALRANKEQCTRRKKNGEKFCGTHIKGIPYGKVDSGIEEPQVIKKRDIWVQDIKGIQYFIDGENNVYNHEDVIANKINPDIIAHYVNKENEYSIPEYNI